MQHLYADVTRLIRRHVDAVTPTGIDKVNVEYARWTSSVGGNLCIKRSDNLRTIPSKKWGPRLLDGDKNQPYSKRNLRLYSVVKALVAGKALPRKSTLMVSSHSWLALNPVWYWLEARNVDVFVFLHDLIPIQYPEYSAPGEKLIHERRVTNTLRHSRGIIVNSNCTASSVNDYAKHRGIKTPPILVAPLGNHTGPRTPACQETTPFFVALGTIEPRKNHLLLLTLWRELAKRLGPKTPKLHIVGRRGWECEQVVDLLDRCESIQPYIVEKNDASDEEVSRLLSGATALLMPSFAEGFGMPVQEALSLGTPVITSPLPAIREFADDIPEYIEPHDGAKWLSTIQAYAETDSPLRAQQLERMRSFQSVCWQDHFKRVENFINSPPLRQR
jgi:glycosyltransferase involved in cell wall biosynthesis